MDVAQNNRPRQVLNEHQARQIFQLKLSHGFPSTHSASTFFADRFKVSSKTIRDIWKGRSWLKVTTDLWDAMDRPIQKTLGRPKGKKDSKPRKTSNQKVANTAEAKVETTKNVEDNAVSISFAELKIVFDREEAELQQSIYTLQQGNMTRRLDLDALPVVPSIWNHQESHETANCDGLRHQFSHFSNYQQESMPFISCLSLQAQSAQIQYEPSLAFFDPHSIPVNWTPIDRLDKTHLPYAANPSMLYADLPSRPLPTDHDPWLPPHD
jgi:hypothetical protein